MGNITKAWHGNDEHILVLDYGEHYLDLVYGEHHLIICYGDKYLDLDLRCEKNYIDHGYG